MSIDYVRQALARMLGVKLHHIGKWELRASSDAARYVGGFAQGMRIAEMRVQFHGEAFKRIHHLVTSESSGSLRLANRSMDHFNGLVEDMSIDILLLYGKETQHIFKALHQGFRVRGKPPKRRKK